MAAEILLSSEAFIKAQTNISDNVAGKYILPSLREAQEVGLKSIVGETMLAKLKSLVEKNEVNADGNAVYKELLDKAQYYLAYMTIVEIVNKVTFKIGNAGLVRTTDENMQTASQSEIVTQIEYYQGKADFYCVELQNYILNNIAQLPEINEGARRRIKANLYSAATCGIFLGGARGKRR